MLVHKTIVRIFNNIYDNLKVWVDANSDGVSGADELKTLSDLDITSINLDSTSTTDTELQNNISDTSTFTQNGETKTLNDVWFATDTNDTAYEHATDISDTVLAMPNIKGSGRVKDLQDAMSEDATLRTKVQNVLDAAKTSDNDTLRTLTKDVLVQWTHTDNISATQTRGVEYILNHSYGSAHPAFRYRIYADARDVAMLENFAGKEFSMYTHGSATSDVQGTLTETSDVLGTEMAKVMQDRLTYLQDSTLIKLLAQDIYGSGMYDATTGEMNYTTLFNDIQSSFTNNADVSENVALLAALVHRDGLSILDNFNSDTLDSSTFQDALSANGVSYTVNSDGSISGSYKDTVEGSAGDDTLHATDSGTVYGGDGDDIIYGTNGLFHYGDLGINLSEIESIDKKEISKEVFLEEDFCSPLVLDLNGNSINSTRLNESSVYFDMDGDGFKEITAWVENGDGLLVLDKNANGTIDNGRELFGNYTPLKDGTAAKDAFEALMPYDENKDGVIDKNDSIYSSLKVWKDNGDGITQTGELINLNDAGVNSIGLNPYQTLLSLYDDNGDGVINTQDAIYSKMMLKTNSDGTQNVYLPESQESYVNTLLAKMQGDETLITNLGDITLSSIASSALVNVATGGADTKMMVINNPLHVRQINQITREVV